MTEEKKIKPAVFLDRDGVIVENRSNYILSWDDVEIFEPAIDALVKYSTEDMWFFIVTNQSPVGRGLFTHEEAEEINEKLISIIRERGGRIDRAFICPHAPQENCNCRKPMPGMLLAAAETHPVDWKNSIMIGDALSDVEAGKRAGVGTCAILKTGRGIDQLKLPEASKYEDIWICNHLSEALESFFASDR